MPFLRISYGCAAIWWNMRISSKSEVQCWIIVMTFTRILRTEVVQRTDLRIPYGSLRISYGFLRIPYRVQKNLTKTSWRHFAQSGFGSLRIPYGFPTDWRRLRLLIFGWLVWPGLCPGLAWAKGSGMVRICLIRSYSNYTEMHTKSMRFSSLWSTSLNKNISYGFPTDVEEWSSCQRSFLFFFKGGLFNHSYICIYI